MDRNNPLVLQSLVAYRPTRICVELTALIFAMRKVTADEVRLGTVVITVGVGVVSIVVVIIGTTASLGGGNDLFGKFINDLGHFADSSLSFANAESLVEFPQCIIEALL